MFYIESSFKNITNKYNYVSFTVLLNLLLHRAILGWGTLIIAKAGFTLIYPPQEKEVW